MDEDKAGNDPSATSTSTSTTPAAEGVAEEQDTASQVLEQLQNQTQPPAPDSSTLVGDPPPGRPTQPVVPEPAPPEPTPPTPPQPPTSPLPSAPPPIPPGAAEIAGNSFPRAGSPAPGPETPQVQYEQPLTPPQPAESLAGPAQPPTQSSPDQSPQPSFAAASAMTEAASAPPSKRHLVLVVLILVLALAIIGGSLLFFLQRNKKAQEENVLAPQRTEGNESLTPSPQRNTSGFQEQSLPEQEIPTPQKIEGSYLNENLGISFIPPPGWEEIKSSVGGLVTVRAAQPEEDQNGNPFYPNLSIQVDQPVENFPNYLAENSQSLVLLLNYKKISEEEAVIADQPGHKIDFTFRYGAFILRQKHNLISKDQKVFDVIYTTLPHTWKKNLELFENSLASLKFIGKRA